MSNSELKSKSLMYEQKLLMDLVSLVFFIMNLGFGLVGMLRLTQNRQGKWSDILEIITQALVKQFGFFSLQKT